MLKVPYLGQEYMEDTAAQLLGEYERGGGLLQLPIPIEDIICNHLQLELEIDDLKTELGTPDVLGGIYFEEQRIVIDSSLENFEGRYNFTAAHEVAHWALHRQFFLNDPNQTELFSAKGKSAIICREAHARTPPEYQADFTAACIMMPPDRLATTVKEYKGKPALIFRPSTRFGNYEDFKYYFASQFNKTYGVSVQAMGIRLEHLRLIRDGRKDLLDIPRA